MLVDGWFHQEHTTPLLQAVLKIPSLFVQKWEKAVEII